jgi:hypothetical protein
MYKTGTVRINVILMCVRVILLLWKNNKFYIFRVCVYSLSYPACNADVMHYIVICDLSGCTIFFLHYPINGTILGKSYRT